MTLSLSRQVDKLCLFSYCPLQPREARNHVPDSHTAALNAHEHPPAHDLSPHPLRLALLLLLLLLRCGLQRIHALQHEGDGEETVGRANGRKHHCEERVIAPPEREQHQHCDRDSRASERSEREPAVGLELRGGGGEGGGGAEEGEEGGREQPPCEVAHRVHLRHAHAASVPHTLSLVSCIPTSVQHPRPHPPCPCTTQKTPSQHTASPYNAEDCTCSTTWNTAHNVAGP
eukprot:608982-Rhodomonas_salina.1